MKAPATFIALAILLVTNANLHASDSDRYDELPTSTPITLIARLSSDNQIDPALDAYGIYGADSDEEAEITATMDMFSESNLALPPLRIYVHDGTDECGGNLGLFSRGGDMHRVDVCMPHIGLIRHELAHAWEYHNVDDSTRQAFMDRAAIDGWNDPEQPHPTRGVERAAFIIAWGSESQPIQMISGGHYAEDLARYELLTGSPSPRISHWGDTPSAARPANVDAMRLAAAASQPEALRS